MKILLISSSPRKDNSQTLHLAKEVLIGTALDPQKIEIIHLCDKKIDFCFHCEKCHRKIMDCPLKDDVKEILVKMLEAEGIIFATPNYINHITASMKALFERASHFIHCSRFQGKYLVGVVSSGSGRDTEVLEYIKLYANICGAQYSGGVSSVVPIHESKKQEAILLGQKFIKDINEKTQCSEQIKSINAFKKHFKRVVEIRKEAWIGEHLYWRDKGWI